MKKTIYTLFAILGFANFTKAQLPSYVPTNGLVAYWGYSGNAIDSSGNGNNGTVNGATLTTDRFGNVNKAYYFSGLACGTRVDASVNTTSIQTGLTISIWVMRSGNGCYGPRIFEFWPGHGGSSHSQWGWDNSTTSIWMGSVTSTGFSCYAGVPISSNNIWTHLVYTNNGSNGYFYKDGVLDTIISSIGNPVLAGTVSFGRMNHPAYDAFNGKLDDIGIWNRALSVTEISNLFLANNCNDTITTQPNNQIGNKGTNKTFSFAHSGTGNSYQWQSNAAVLGWQNVPNITPYNGATTNSLTVNNLTVSNHNQMFRVVTSKTGCKDTSNTVSLTLANIATDSLRLLRLQADSSRLTNESVIYLARINKLMNDSAYYTSRILKLSNDSVYYVSRIAKLTNDSVYYTSRITKLISDSNVFVARINKLSYDSVINLGRITKLSNDSIYYIGRITKLISDSNVFVARINKLSYDSLINLGRITKLSNDSVYYSGRITKLISDSNVFVDKINRLSYDSLINLGRITTLKIDSINNKTTISLLNADIVTKGNIITFLQLDSTNKGIIIRQLQTDLINKHDTVYIASSITSDTLRIAIHTGISGTSPIINSLKVYPNPASTLLHIDLEKPGYFTAKLSSITGQSIITPTNGTIDVSALANGVYILTIYDSNNKLISTNKVAIIK